MQVSTISVIYLDGTLNHVHKDVLDVLIATGKIRQFKRNGEWISLWGKGIRLRNYDRRVDFKGPERRAPWPAKEHNRMN